MDDEDEDDDDEDDDDEDDESDDMECEDEEGEDGIGDEGPPRRRKPPTSTGLKKSAAGLCVSAGSFSDPADMPGMKS